MYGTCVYNTTKQKMTSKVNVNSIQALFEESPNILLGYAPYIFHKMYYTKNMSVINMSRWLIN